MTLLRRFRSWSRSILRRSSLENEVDEEFRSHIQALAGDLIRSAVPAAQAVRCAMRVDYLTALRYD
jgi:hypothetical protein